jgi:quinol-cytochrome oxidoreductase complex cytochrome b subunit
VSKDFWLMWVLFLLFIIFAAGMTAWGGYPEFAIFWVISGVIGTLALAYFFRHDSSNNAEE